MPMNMPEAEVYLSQIPLWTRQKNTLHEVRDFLNRLGNPEDGLRIIHVAGTNGKGSVCADLTGILTQAGYRVGTFVSPHLVDIRERFLLNGVMIDDARFQEAFAAVYPVVQQMTGEGYCHPTFFEYLFLMAMVLFRKERMDFLVIETGLGGLLDTTNVIRHPEAVIITSISLDHTRYLGNTIEEIAAQKAGIIKPGAVLVYDDNQPEASAVIAAKGKQEQVAAYPVKASDSYRDVEFAAPYQAMNAALAVKALEVLHIAGVDEDVCRRGLKAVYWQGRMEHVREDIWLDGAHNPGGIRAFTEAAAILQKKHQKNIHLLFAAVDDKDYNEMIQMLCGHLHPVRVTVTQLASERSLNLQSLVEAFMDAGCESVEAYTGAEAALDAAYLHKSEADRLFVIGSLYLIGEIKETLRRK